MRDAVIVEAVRTPIGKPSGALHEVHSVALLAHSLFTLVERTVSIPRSSTTSSAALCRKWANRGRTIPAQHSSPPVIPSRCPAPQSTGSALAVSRPSISPRRV
jgi:acetyl-CoA acetyltransferase